MNMESKKKMNKQTKTHKYREEIGGYQRGRGLGGVWNGWSGSVVWWWTAARHLVVISVYCIQMLNYEHLKLNAIYQSFNKTWQRLNMQKLEETAKVRISKLLKKTKWDHECSGWEQPGEEMLKCQRDVHTECSYRWICRCGKLR